MPSSIAIEAFVHSSRVLTDGEWFAAIEGRKQLFVNRKKELLFRTFGNLSCLLNERGHVGEHTLIVDKPVKRNGSAARYGPNLTTRGFFWVEHRRWDEKHWRNQQEEFGHRTVWGFSDQSRWFLGEIAFVRLPTQYERALDYTLVRVEPPRLPAFQRSDLSVRDAALHVLRRMREEAELLSRNARKSWHPAHALLGAIIEEDKNIRRIEFGR